MDGRRKSSKAVDLFFLEFQRGMKIDIQAMTFKSE